MGFLFFVPVWGRFGLCQVCFVLLGTLLTAGCEVRLVLLRKYYELPVLELACLCMGVLAVLV